MVRPNQSLSWRGNLLLLASLAAVCFAIAAGFAFAGLWLVLPFAGLEVVVVGLGLYLTARRLANSEVISITPKAVRIESGYRRVERSQRMRRDFASVELRHGAARAHPSRLIIRSHGEEAEVGSCLTEAERERLAAQLRELLARGAGGRPDQ